MRECITHHHACDCREAKSKRIEEALREIAKQKMQAELSEDCYLDADFESGYDALIDIARKALAIAEWNDTVQDSGYLRGGRP